MDEKYVELLIRHPELMASADELIAELHELDYEGFWEKGDALLCYIPQKKFNPVDLLKVGKLLEDPRFEYNWTVVHDRNWNKLWEDDFDPVLVVNRCRIRAPFHKKVPGIEYDIIIEPQMSFGTGHHETTVLVVELMLGMNFESRKVLDMGTGTGVLAILASLMGSENILAVDNNSWAYDNALHNVKLNNIDNIRVLKGDVDSIKNRLFDIIIANINRNTLLDHLMFYSSCLAPGGILLLSGFFEVDLEIISSEAKKYHFKLEKYVTRNDWVAVKYSI